jgi:shikimate kinase
LVLTGFMGTGKSTIGRRVSALTGRPFVDTDDEIVRRAGKSISAIFREEGEAAFRAHEQRICRALARVPGLVIATGGGTLVNAESRALMMQAGLVVCLEAAPEVIEARLRANTDRPLAANWRELLAARQAAYAEIPLHIDTGSREVDDIAEELIELWRVSL